MMSETTSLLRGQAACGKYLMQSERVPGNLSHCGLVVVTLHRYRWLWCGFFRLPTYMYVFMNVYVCGTWIGI